MNKIMKTARLVMKPYEEADQNDLAELLTNDEIKKMFMIPDFLTREELLHMVEALMNRSLCDEHFHRGIYSNRVLIGFVNDVEINNGVIELGYVIHPEYHNKGYATEMLQAIIEELLHSGFSAVTAGAFIENAASIRVMQKCGMEKIDREEDIVYRGIKRHCVYYAIFEE